MNFDFSDDQLAIPDAVEAICADFGADCWQRDGRWPGEAYEAVARDGWFGGFGFAQEYHVERGLCERNLPLLAPVTLELARCCVAEQALGLPVVLIGAAPGQRIRVAAESRLAPPAGTNSGDRPPPGAWESATWELTPPGGEFHEEV